MFGIPAIAADWHVLAAGARGGRAAYDAAHDRLVRRAQSVRGRGACRFPDGVSGLVLSATRVLGQHLLVHATGHCPAATSHRRSSHDGTSLAG
jgi:hypothetical protein